MKKLMMTLCLLLSLLTVAKAESDMELISINVGKGDSHLLRCGAITYLVDTGKAEYFMQVSKTLHAMGIHHLDGVILTHTHKDHTGGAMALALSDVVIDAWYAPAYYAEVSEKKHPAIKAAEADGKQVIWLKGGDTLPFGEGVLNVLGPVEPDGKENNNSLVLEARLGSSSLLMTGDMEFPEEGSLLNRGLLSPVDVLKVGNHGEEDATSTAFIRQVQPKLAVISTNTREEPDTPHPRVTTLLREAGATIVVTQEVADAIQIRMADGQTEVKALSFDVTDAIGGVALVEKNVAQDTIWLQNQSDAIADISGWILYSDKGNELFVFPAGSRLAPGQTVSITTESSPIEGDYAWPEKKVWHKSKADKAMLYDAYGRLISELP